MDDRPVIPSHANNLMSVDVHTHPFILISLYFLAVTMPHSFGYRARTRHLFAKDFKKKGMPAPNTYLRTFKVRALNIYLHTLHAYTHIRGAYERACRRESDV